MFVEVGNAPIYVDVVGEGEPALFLHGVPDSAELWRPLLKEVSSDYRCYLTDLPGFYRS
ncbi:alpha/beta fold hydrolase, partial [Oleiphilus sp. HI0125]